MDDKEKLKEEVAQIVENTLRWTSWVIEWTRAGNNTILTTAAVKEVKMMTTATLNFDFEMGPNVKTFDDIATKYFSEVWKKADTYNKIDLAKDFFELELIKTRSALADKCIKEQRNTQKILFSPGNKRWNTVKYIDRMYDENVDDIFKELAENKTKAKISHKNVIESALRILILRLHPKIGGDAERFKILEEMGAYLLYVDLEHVDISEIHEWIEMIYRFRVYVELNFQITRKLLQGKPIPKNWLAFLQISDTDLYDKEFWQW